MSALRNNYQQTYDITNRASIANPQARLRQNSVPIDPCHCVKFGTFLLGIGVQITPSALLLCAYYYHEQYTNLPDLIYYLVPTYSISNIIFLLILNKWQTKISFTLQIVLSFMLSAIALFGIVQSANDQLWNLIILFLIVFVIGMATSILTQSMLGFTYILEPSYKHIHISGDSLSGIIAAIIRMITRICYGNDAVSSSNAYFIIIAAYCTLCAILFSVIRCTNYVAWRLNIYILHMTQFNTLHQAQGNHSQPILSPYTQKKLEQQEHSLHSQQHAHPHHHQQQYIAHVHANAPQRHVFSSNERYRQLSIDDLDHERPDDDDLSTILSVHNPPSTADASVAIGDHPSVAEKYEKLVHDTHDDEHHQDTVDITNFLSTLSYKRHHKDYNASLLGAGDSVVSSTNHTMRDHSIVSSAKSHRSEQYATPKRSYSALGFLDRFSLSELIKLSGKMKPFCFVLLLTNILTWSVIPGLISGKVRSNVLFINGEDWQSIVLMSEYYITQYIGRIILSSPRFWCCCCKYDQRYGGGETFVLIRHPRCCPICCKRKNSMITHVFLLRLCLLRIVVVYPVFVLIYIGYYASSWIAHILMLLVGVSEGYIYRMAVALAPHVVSRHKREAAASILTFVYFTGMAIGSLMAVLTLYVVQFNE